MNVPVFTADGATELRSTLLGDVRAGQSVELLLYANERDGGYFFVRLLDADRELGFVPDECDFTERFGVLASALGVDSDVHLLDHLHEHWLNGSSACRIDTNECPELIRISEQVSFASHPDRAPG